MARDAYRDAGVDIDAGDALVERIKPFAARTTRPGVLGGIGAFGGLFQLQGYTDPVLVSGTDGVGTKLLVAQRLNRHDTIGQDLVAMCVNDVAVMGAEPLYFLDYFATGKLDVDVAAEVVAGIARACEMAGCALLGGETAELPDLLDPHHYDLAGFAVGVVERSAILDGTRIQAGDALVGVPSSGLHSNGYSLVRRLLVDGDRYDLQADPGDLGRSLADELLEPTRLYPRLLQGVRSAWDLRGASHVTGGGLPGNVPRMLPTGLAIRMWRGSWPVPPIFALLQHAGGLTEAEMVRTFNCGLGLVLAVPAEEGEPLAEAIGGAVVGEVVEGEGWELTWKARVAVLASGTGTNLLALLDASFEFASPYDIVVVGSDKPGAKALAHATNAGIPTVVVPRRSPPDRAAFDRAMAAALALHSPDWICLAGYMRLVTPVFLQAFPNRILNIHPALLPAFPGLHAQQQAFDAGVAIAGCTVHFVTEETDAGPIIAQAAVPVLPTDDAETLRLRILRAEHQLYPRVVEWVAAGLVTLEGSRVRRTPPAQGAWFYPEP